MQNPASPFPLSRVNLWYVVCLKAIFTLDAFSVCFCPFVHLEPLIFPASFVACGLVMCVTCSRSPSVYAFRDMVNIRAKVFPYHVGGGENKQTTELCARRRHQGDSDSPMDLIPVLSDPVPSDSHTLLPAFLTERVEVPTIVSSSVISFLKLLAD